MQDESAASKKVVKRLERVYGVDLSMYSHPPQVANPRTAYATGLAAVSSLRSLRVKYTIEPNVGVMICEADDISSWIAYRYTALVDSKARRQRRKKATTPTAPASPWNESVDMMFDEDDDYVASSLDFGGLGLSTRRNSSPAGSSSLGRQTRGISTSSWTEPTLSTPPPQVVRTSLPRE